MRARRHFACLVGAATLGFFVPWMIAPVESVKARRQEPSGAVIVLTPAQLATFGTIVGTQSLYAVRRGLVDRFIPYLNGTLSSPVISLTEPLLEEDFLRLMPASIQVEFIAI